MIVHPGSDKINAVIGACSILGLMTTNVAGLFLTVAFFCAGPVCHHLYFIYGVGADFHTEFVGPNTRTPREEYCLEALSES
jgi:hypothetical protein